MNQKCKARHSAYGSYMWNWRLPLDAGGSSQRRVKGQITGSSAGGLQKVKACLRCRVTVWGLGNGSVFNLQVVPKLGDAAA